MTNVFTRVRRGTQDVVFQSVALMEHGEPTEDEIVYRIADGDGSAMIMNAATGQLRLSTHSEEGKYKLTVTAELRNSRIFQSTTVKVSILPRADHCSLQAKDVCFWETADYQVYENRVSTYVGYLGPGSGCQYSPTRYRLLNGTEYLEIKDAEIFTRSDGGKILDREVIPFFIVTVACEYKNTKLNRTLRVTVLDEDDNPPYMQTRASDIYVKPGEKVETDVMFLDKDVVGEHVVTILGDHRHILNVSQSVYNTPLTVVEGKVVNCRVYTTRPANASALPYSVTLRMNNTSLLPGYGVSHVDMPLVLRTAEPRALAQSSEVTYNETSLTVTRDAAPYTRITQPLEAVTLEGLSGPVFEMDNAAFGVTKKAGIVYVKNETALKAAPNQTSVTINWTHEGGSEGTVQLLITISSASCKPNVTHINGWPICAETKSYKNCVSNCGLGVGKVKKNGISRCEWRGERKPIDKNLNRNYSTCTPDIQTCPDGWCDPLEKSALGICPQDCTHDVVGGNMHPTKKMGVYSGVGVCSCEVFQFEKCSCGPMNRYLLSRDNKGNATSPSTPQVIMKPDISHYTTPPPDIAAMKSVQSSKCGAICLAGIVACSVFVTGAFAVLLMACRSRIHGKGWRRERKLANSVTFAGHDATRQSTDTLLLTFDPATPTPTESNTTPANDASNSLTPDPKWEFPRERLTIEQCLGEGEFGRVLKATALDIAGSKGYTSVAVKTLKEDASAGELGDLISEYKMLKEVSHPNVIKLLGASTIPGGPIYIIIEFSEHGSLRNYLRRSRHMGTDGTQASSSFSTSSTPSVTARDVLSFAWQISKGMAYLTDIKLVHRDLAARNVLLATGKVCKISDFGLTRDVYEDDAYLKRSKGRVPVKWMALESLSDHVYTSKTDVWSFGVLLWELVTLGASPYPGVAVHNLFYLLRAGYRMEKPENCSDELYNIMRSCWVEDPMERPPFKQVTAILEQMLADGTEYLNLDLNSRMAVNRAYFTDLPEDNLDFQITNFNYKVPRRQPKEVADNAVARSYVNGQVTAVQYENEKVPAEATELERYESPIRVINTTLSTQPPASYVPMSPKTTLVTES